MTPTRIDEEGDTFPDGVASGGEHHHSHTPGESDNDPAVLVLPKMTNRTRHHSKMSRPIPIGIHHTVSGHEAMDLAKRLNEELAAQQQQQQQLAQHQASGSFGAQPLPRPLSPKSEPRARSLEQSDTGMPGENFAPFTYLIFICIYLPRFENSRIRRTGSLSKSADGPQ